MPGSKRPERELARQWELLAAPQVASRPAQRQIGRAIRAACGGAEGSVATNLEPSALAAGLDWVSAEALQGGQEQFRAVALFGFIETCADPARTIEMLRDRLRPGGLLMLGAPNARFAARVMALKEARSPGIANVGALMRPDRRKVVYTPRGLCALFERTGFEQVRVASAAPTVTDRSTSHVQLLTYALGRLIDLVAPRYTFAGSILCMGLRKD
jgi:hypothetical protein